MLEDQRDGEEERLRAACALATYTPAEPRWEKVSEDVAAQLIARNPFVIGKWADALHPVRAWLLPPLALFLGDERRTGSERGLIAKVYASFAEGEADAFVRLEKRLAEESEPHAAAEARITVAKRQANIALSVLLMGQGEKV